MFRAAKAKPITRLNLILVKLLIVLCVLVGLVDLVDPTLISVYASLGCGVLFMAAVLWLLQRIVVAVVNAGGALAGLPVAKPSDDVEPLAKSRPATSS
jgi:hypothetical protein